jgi:monoamine oxidase
VELADWLSARLESHGSKICRNQNVRVVRWKRNYVEAVAETSEGLEKHHAATAIITLPLGVLQAEPEEGVFFDPELPGKRTPIMSLRMGFVMKITLQFTHRFWPVENFGFIHSEDELFPVWWADERGPVLTGWAGAGRAEWLAREDTATICAEAIMSLSRIFGMERRFVERKVRAHYFHNWIADTFSRGAYSFTPARMSKMAGELAEPISGTLFFAGEATDTEGNQGTVHGAFKSGERAANEVLRVLRRRRRVLVS